MISNERRDDSRVQDIAAAAALAGHYFPRRQADGVLSARIEDVVFFLSGHVELWSLWPSLPGDEQELIATLLRCRDVDLANETVVQRVLDYARSSPPPGIVIPPATPIRELYLRLGLPALEDARERIELLRHERALRAKKFPLSASPGSYAAPLYVGRGRGQRSVATLNYDLEVISPERPEPIDIGDPVRAERLSVSIAELRSIADVLDAAGGNAYRRESVDKIFDNLVAQPGHDVDETLTLDAGLMQVLHAPTGFGKSVLTELLACWFAQHRRTMTILVATNANVIKTAHAITRHLEVLNGGGARAVALTSPNSAQEAAEAAIRGDPTDAGDGIWAMQTMGYGCALSAAATTDRPVDAWEPGREPCTSLRASSAGVLGRQTYTCPWISGCGKFRNARDACTASIVVTTFSNWLTGVVQVPVRAQGEDRADMSVEELLLHRSDLVLIDEVDEFQATMIKGQASQIVLARQGAEETPLRRIWAELPSAGAGINGAIRGDARSATNLAMELAEGYVSHLADGDFDKAGRRGPRDQPLLGRWMLPNRWDGILTASLFGLSDEESATPQQYRTFRALFDHDADVVFPDWWQGIQSGITMIQVNSGSDAFEQARELIDNALATGPHDQLHDDTNRARTVDRIMRRSYLGTLRQLLTTYIYLGPNLTAAGVASASEISDKLRRYRQWRAAPLGPLGRTLFAFSEVYDPDRLNDTALNVNAFGGDPHTYITGIGEITSLSHLGTRRCVLGLSATSYFPGAPHHHVHVRPTWWVPDSSTGGFDLLATPVTGSDGDFIRISGTSGAARRETMVRLGGHLWTKRLQPELARLAADPDTENRQRLLLATTSYEGAEDLARGIAGHGVPREHLVLATRPDEAPPGPPSSAWQELPANQLERFGHDVDGKILIAPLARAARGINLADANGKSLVGSVWLIVRPVPIIDEPAEILAHVHAVTKASAAPTDDPGGRLGMVRQAATAHLNSLFRTLPYFSHLPKETRRSIAAENLVGLIQLAGRTRRGGTRGRIHLVDAAFLDGGAGSDFPHLIEDLVREWGSDIAEPLPLLRALYGDTLSTILSYAAERT